MLKYNLDIGKKSKWVIITPHQGVKSRFIHVTEIGNFYAGSDFYTERTGKPEYYILYTISGQGILRYRGAELTLGEGDAVLIYCEEYQYYKTESEETWHHLWIHFNGPSCRSYHEVINETAVNKVIIDDRDGFVSDFNAILKSPDVNDLNDSILCSMHVTNLLTAMVMAKYRVRPKVIGQQEEAITHSINYIKEHFTEKISLEQLAEEVHLSKYYYMKLFKEHTGMSPYEYLINSRINAAKKLLRRTSDPISKVAYSVGFLDECNFIRKFKMLTGITPLGFRRLSDTLDNELLE